MRYSTRKSPNTFAYCQGNGAHKEHPKEGILDLLQLCGRKEVLKALLKGLMSCLRFQSSRKPQSTLPGNQAKHYETRATATKCAAPHLLTTGAPSLFRLADSQDWPHKDIKTCFEEATP